MSTPSTTTRTSTVAEDVPSDDGLTLLLDLLARGPLEQPRRRRVRAHRAGSRERLQDWMRRAALWGAGPQGAWRAW